MNLFDSNDNFAVLMATQEDKWIASTIFHYKWERSPLQNIKKVKKNISQSYSQYMFIRLTLSDWENAVNNNKIGLRESGSFTKHSSKLVQF